MRARRPKRFRPPPRRRFPRPLAHCRRSLARKTLPPPDIGKEFERSVKGALDSLKQRGQLAYARLYDTQSAQGYLPPQPADFVGIAKGLAFLLECKASEEHDTLATCISTVDRAQAANLGLWARQGCNSIVLFYAAMVSKVEVWDGGQVSAARGSNKKLFEPAFIGPMSQLERVLEKALVR